MNFGNAPSELTKLLSGAQLPALPQSAIRLLELSQDPDNGPPEFAVPIEADPGLTGQVLRFVNSSYFGFAREISSVRLAITLVGIRTIKNFALWSAVFSLMPNPKCGPFDLKKLWRDSLRRAIFARRMGKIVGLREAEDLFAAALLQDMAVPLLAKEMPQRYTELLDRRQAGAVRLSHLEEDRFGWTHAQAGAVIARGWSLPDDFAHLIESHTQLERVLNESPNELRQVAVGLSALLPASVDSTWSERELFESTYSQVTGGGGPELHELLPAIDRDLEEFAPVLKLPTSGKSLLESYQEAAGISA